MESITACKTTALKTTACMLALTLFATQVAAHELNGFNLKSQILDQDFVLQIGQPNRESVRSNPEHLSVKKADWDDTELVMGVAVGDQSRAYPLSVLFNEQLVNDTIGDVPVLVSFCSLCGSGAVYERTVGGEVLEFAESGLLYRSDELFYDVQTNSLWSSFINTSVSGPSEGHELADLSWSITEWGQWRSTHPKTTVLARPTGAQAGEQFKEERLSGLLNHQGYHPKMPTLGLSWPDGEAIAFPAGEVLEAGGNVQEFMDDKPIEVSFNTESQQFKLNTKLDLKVFRGTWGEWQAAHPEGSWYVKEDVAESTGEQLQSGDD